MYTANGTFSKIAAITPALHENLNEMYNCRLSTMRMRPHDFTSNYIDCNVVSYIKRFIINQYTYTIIDYIYDLSTFEVYCKCGDRVYVESVIMFTTLSGPL